MLPKTHLRCDPSLVGEVMDLCENRALIRLKTSVKMIADDLGLIHGGFLFGLADFAAMTAVNQPTVVLAASSVKFLHPVKMGQTLMAAARVRSVDGRRYTVDVTVHVEGVETPCMTGEFSCFVPEKHVLER